MEQVAEKFHTRTRKDECGDVAIFGRLWEDQPDQENRGIPPV
jgi:hypothetical protein